MKNFWMDKEKREKEIAAQNQGDYFVYAGTANCWPCGYAAGSCLASQSFAANPPEMLYVQGTANDGHSFAANNSVTFFSTGTAINDGHSFTMNVPEIVYVQGVDRSKVPSLSHSHSSLAGMQDDNHVQYFTRKTSNTT